MSTTFCGDLIIEKNIIKCISSGNKKLCFVFVGDDLDYDKEITKNALVYYIINNSIRIYGKVSDIKGNQCTIELDGYQRESINTVVKNKDELFVRPNHESILKLKENKKLNEEEKEQLRKYLGIDNSNFNIYKCYNI